MVSVDELPRSAATHLCRKLAFAVTGKTAAQETPLLVYQVHRVSSLKAALASADTHGKQACALIAKGPSRTAVAGHAPAYLATQGYPALACMHTQGVVVKEARTYTAAMAGVRHGIASMALADDHGNAGAHEHAGCLHLGEHAAAAACAAHAAGAGLDLL